DCGAPQSLVAPRVVELLLDSAQDGRRRLAIIERRRVLLRFGSDALNERVPLRLVDSAAEIYGDDRSSSTRREKLADLLRDGLSRSSSLGADDDEHGAR